MDANAPGSWRLGQQTIEPKSILATNDYLHLRSRALAGEAITELPPFLAAAAIRAGQLVALLQDEPLLEQQINLLYHIVIRQRLSGHTSTSVSVRYQRWPRLAASLVNRCPLVAYFVEKLG
ncbi:LysR substrate-binding domain-containing protein [Pseudoxanthomonas mexicana]|nr:hypothetical protein [Pseudoxanthomonas sp.]